MTIPLNRNFPYQKRYKGKKESSKIIHRITKSFMFRNGMLHISSQFLFELAKTNQSKLITSWWSLFIKSWLVVPITRNYMVDKKHMIIFSWSFLLPSKMSFPCQEGGGALRVLRALRYHILHISTYTVRRKWFCWKVK